MADIRALISHVGDTSNLILDPDLDSYYLMDAVLLKLPEVEDLLAQIRFLGEDIIARKSLTAGAKAQLIVLAGLLKANSDATKKGVSIVLQRDFFTSLPRTLLAQAFKRALAVGEIGDVVATLVVLDDRQGDAGVERLPRQHHVEQLASLRDGQRWAFF